MVVGGRGVLVGGSWVGVGCRPSDAQPTNVKLIRQQKKIFLFIICLFLILGAGCRDTGGLRGSCLAILSFYRGKPDLMRFHLEQAANHIFKYSNQPRGKRLVIEWKVLNLDALFCIIYIVAFALHKELLPLLHQLIAVREPCKWIRFVHPSLPFLGARA